MKSSLPDPITVKPGRFGAIPNAMKAFGRVAVAIAQNRSVLVSPEEVERRRAICRSHNGDCYNGSVKMCMECHCFIPAKTQLATEQCPRGYWSRVDKDR